MLVVLAYDDADAEQEKLKCYMQMKRKEVWVREASAVEGEPGATAVQLCDYDQ